MTTATTVNVQFQLRADTAANWTAANPILLANEFALETDTKKLKVGDGTTAWASLAYFPSVVTGGTVLGNLEIGSTGTLTFEGSTADDYETTLAVTDPTADRTITLPDQSGTVVVSGNASIVDADIATGAEIAVSKLANGTANQVLVTDGTDVSWSDDLTIAGNLTVNGTTTTVNTQTLVVEDKNIELGVVDTPTDLTADGGGITLKGATDKTINWIDSTDSWTSSENIDLADGKSYRINDTEVLSSTTLGSGVTSSSLTSVGTITAGTWQGTAIDAAYLDSTVVTTGDTGTVTSTMIADGTIANADVSASAAIAGSKIDPDFGSQTVETTGDLAINTDTLFVDASANAVGIGTQSPGRLLTLNDSGNAGILSFTGGTSSVQSILFGDTGSETRGKIVYNHADDSLSFTVTDSERARIDSSGRLLVGTSSARTNLKVGAGSYSALIQAEGTSIDNSSISAIRNVAGTGAARLFLAKTRGATVNTNTAVVSADTLGEISFNGADGTNLLPGATIAAEVDNGSAGTALTGSEMPGRLVFSTTADGASSPTERMRISNNGAISVGNTLDDYPLEVANTQVTASDATARFSDTATIASVSAGATITLISGASGAAYMVFIHRTDSTNRSAFGMYLSGTAASWTSLATGAAGLAATIAVSGNDLQITNDDVSSRGYSFTAIRMS